MSHHTTQEPREARQIPLGDLILDALKAAYNQGAVCARRDSSAEAMRTATTNAMRAADAVVKRLGEVVPECETGVDLPGRCRCPFPESCSDAGVRR